MVTPLKNSEYRGLGSSRKRDLTLCHRQELCTRRQGKLKERSPYLGKAASDEWEPCPDFHIQSIHRCPTRPSNAHACTLCSTSMGTMAADDQRHAVLGLSLGFCMS